MKLAEAVSERIKELLKEKNMSQYRLKKITRLNEKTVDDIIKCKTKEVKFSTIYIITSAFDMSLIGFLRSKLFDKANIDI